MIERIPLTCPGLSLRTTSPEKSATALTATFGLAGLAGGLRLHLLGQGLAVLAGEFDRGDGRRAAEALGCLRGSPELPPKRVKRKLPIGASGTTGTTVFRSTSLDRGGFGLGGEHHLAAEDEGEVGKDAEARDRVDRTLERRFKQRGVGRRFSDRLAPGALVGGEFCAVAEVAEVALVDLKGFRQGDGERFDVGVAGLGCSVRSRGSGPCCGRWPCGRRAG